MLQVPVRCSGALRRCEPPIDFAAVSKRLVNERVEIGVVFFECLSARDRMLRSSGGRVLAGGVKVGEHTSDPIAGAVVHSGRSLPFAGREP